MSKIKSFACTLALFLAFGFCGMAVANTGDFSGDWQGSWYSYYETTGGLSASITQTGTSISGTVSVLSTECGDFYNLPLTGTVYGGNTASFSTSVTCPYDGSYNELDYSGGVLSANRIDGNYVVYSDGEFWDSGTFFLTRSVNIITASAGAGGSISPSGTVHVNAGGSQTFTITPNAGYSISDVLVDGVSVGSVPSYTFSNIQANYTIAAYFSISAPIADFTANPTSGRNPLTVNFSDQSTGNVTSRSWSFGDGGTSTEQNPSHTYSKPGTYTVSLTVSGPGGSDTETKPDYITVDVAGNPGVPLLLLDDE
jgi:hypothetical protein